MKKNYHTANDVLRDIIGYWQKYAIEQMFQLHSFINGRECNSFEVRGKGRSIYMSVRKNDRDINIRIVDTSGDWNDEVLVQCNLENLHNHINENTNYIESIAEGMVNSYSNMIRRRDKIMTLLEKTKNMDNVRVIREFLVEKM